MTFEQWIALRERCVGDLFFLAQVLGCAICEFPHRQLTDFVVSKTPGVEISELSEIKRRMILGSRGLFKSTVVTVCESAQWLLFDSNIRIAIDSDAMPLSTGLCEQVKEKFTIRTDLQGVPVPTLFQILFPEYCGEASELGPEGELWSPARTNHSLKEPSVLAISLGKATSGSHFEILYFEDAESNQNSGTTASDEARANVGRQIEADSLLADHFVYILGTPYAEDDAYSKIEADGTPTLRIPAWDVRETALTKKAHELEPDEVTLNFEFDADGVSRLPFKKLIREAKADPYLFACQRLVNAGRNTRISEALVQDHILSLQKWTEVSYAQGEIICAWDLAYTPDQVAMQAHTFSRDWTVGSAGWFDPERGVIVTDISRGRWTGLSVAEAIASQALRTRATKIFIENDHLDWLRPQIENALRNVGLPTVQVVGIFRSTEAGAKQFRLNTLASTLHSDKQSIWFNPRIAPDVLAAMIRELPRAKPGTQRKDDIVDSLAHLILQLREQQERPAGDPLYEAELSIHERFALAVLKESIYGRHDPPQAIQSERETPFAPPTTIETPHGRAPVCSSVEEQIFGRLN